MHHRLYVSALFGLFTASALVQSNPPICYKLEEIGACYVAGMGVDCGDYSCPHQILLSDPVNVCVQIGMGSTPEAGKTHCEIDIGLPVARCRRIMMRCVSPDGCEPTGFTSDIYYNSSKITGESCSGLIED